MFSKKSNRSDNAINAGAMADIAFLLLIFFLVTTTILDETGISVKLPPYTDDPIIPLPIADRNSLIIKVNAQNQLMVEGQEMSVAQLRDYTKIFILNPTQNPGLARSPKKAIISLQNDRSTHYDIYIAVYNELKGAYHEIWDEQSKKQYGFAFEQLPSANQKVIRDDFPMVISEAEPTEY